MKNSLATLAMAVILLLPWNNHLKDWVIQRLMLEIVFMYVFVLSPGLYDLTVRRYKYLLASYLGIF